MPEITVKDSVINFKTELEDNEKLKDTFYNLVAEDAIKSYRKYWKLYGTAPNKEALGDIVRSAVETGLEELINLLNLA